MRTVHGASGEKRLWRELWLSCTGPDGGRPLDGSALVALIELAAD
jgi:hypothetical protein